MPNLEGIDRRPWTAADIGQNVCADRGLSPDGAISHDYSTRIRSKRECKDYLSVEREVHCIGEVFNGEIDRHGDHGDANLVLQPRFERLQRHGLGV